MAHCILCCYAREGDATISREPDLDEPLDLWNGGERFNVPVPEPLRFGIDKEDSGFLRPMLDTGSFLLMHRDLIACLRSAGVDNLDVYAAEIRDMATQTVHVDYRAVNIVGIISAVDVASSQGMDFGVSKDGLFTMLYDQLAIDESACKGALMFRLAQTLDIIIDDSVKSALTSAGFERLDFVNAGAR